ncbi:MAG: M20 family metallopeptidase [Chloroflexi bacterium]|nr:M20 family metallopeptidase [Chloroflexota bacterium]
MALSLRLHAHPETGFQEFKAAAWLTEYLEGKAFAVERGYCQLETAFRAVYGNGEPAVAFIAEYDALPGLGHACGHNIIAAAAVGAAVAVREAAAQWGGKVLVIGTPAEEVMGGKAIMAQRMAFQGLDAALMIHPGVRNAVFARSLACIELQVEFYGKAAHAAARPQEGVNALEALILSFNNINSLRQHTKDRARIHGIITHGGQAPNIVPAHSAATFLVRAEDDHYLEELMEKVLNCFRAASLATGARLEHRWSAVRYAPMRTNHSLARLFAHNLESLGRRVIPSDGGLGGMGSTDMGNVSQLVPSIHPSVAIAPKTVLGHTPEFAAAAASSDGLKGLLDGSRALAMTWVDLVLQPEALAKVREEFYKGRPGGIPGEGEDEG